MWHNTNECNIEFLRTPISATSITPIFPSVFTHLHAMQHRAGSCVCYLSLSCSSSFPIAMNQQSSCRVTRAVGPNPTNPFASRASVIRSTSSTQSQSSSNWSEIPTPVYWCSLAQGILEDERFSHLDLFYTKKNHYFFPFLPKRFLNHQPMWTLSVPISQERIISQDFFQHPMGKQAWKLSSILTCVSMKYHGK